MEGHGWDKNRFESKCLRLDNGGESIDGRFNECYAAHGIWMKKTIPGTPQ